MSTEFLLSEAKEISRVRGIVSISWLQRKLRISYPSAAHIVDTLVEQGFCEKDYNPNIGGRYIISVPNISFSEVLQMKLFEMRQIREAIAYATQGGQALHVHTLNKGHWLFARYPEIGHLFDQNRERLIYLAGRLGVNVIKIEREGTARQHIDLCGKPFEYAKEIAKALQQS